MSKVKWGVMTCFLALVMLACAVPFGYSLPEGIFGKLESVFQPANREHLIVLDPGHGGMDGGAVSAEGICEKDINLAIAFYIRELAEVDGWKIKMTREGDQSVQYERHKGRDEEDRSIRSMKTEDLLARKEQINK
ncbi:MAG: N-acetylmuramoyl-L-alanine amidase, partial [Anaerovorax sp.]